MTTKYYIETETIDGKIVGTFEFPEGSVNDPACLKEIFYDSFMEGLEGYENQILQYCIKNNLSFQYRGDTIAIRIRDLLKSGITITTIPYEI